MLKADIPAVLDNIRRIMPEANPIQVLVAQPQVGRRVPSLHYTISCWLKPHKALCDVLSLWDLPLSG